MTSASKKIKNTKWTMLLIAVCVLPTSVHQLSTDNNNATVPELQLSTAGNITRDENCNVTTTFQIPGICMTVAMKKDHFQYNSASKEICLNTGLYDTGTTSRYENHNKTVDFCFPLSPQLQNCELRKFGPDCYEITNQKFTILASNLSSELGDYYLDSDKNAYICQQYIRPSSSRPRCNYIQLDMGQYALEDDGSLYINATNTTIRMPMYSINNDMKVNACYPLSINFLNCHIESAMLMHSYLYDREPGLKIYFRGFRKLYNVDEYYYRNNDRAVLILCTPEDPLDAVILRYLYNTFKYLSLFLVCITISHHLMAPKITVHAKCLISYYSSGMAFFILTMLPPMQCYAHFVISYLTSNAAVIWVNIASYDIWRSFTTMHKSPNKNHGSNKSKSDAYKYYSIIGWGGPIALCIFTLLLDKYYAMQGSLLLSPLVGLTENCWFHDKWISFGLHFGLILILSLVNAVFFILTIYSIYKGSQGTELVNKRRKKQMYIVRFKLFIIMGLALVMEGFAFCLQEHFNFQFWYIADAFISIQGIAIFFAETCKREAFQLMSNRFRHNTNKLLQKLNIPILNSMKLYTATSQGTTSESAGTGST